jgi:hypothetical protein
MPDEDGGYRLNQIFYPVGHWVRVLSSPYPDVEVGLEAQVDLVTAPDPRFDIYMYHVGGHPFLDKELEGIYDRK